MDKLHTTRVEASSRRHESVGTPRVNPMDHNTCCVTVALRAISELCQSIARAISGICR
ncbi:MAG: hypothetical protein MRY21_06105 [Simkaniaceae bacterium]|nr:hypothetical protein [Simkaniaceae bacterium]